jgi:hypothetical protein
MGETAWAPQQDFQGTLFVICNRWPECLFTSGQPTVRIPLFECFRTQKAGMILWVVCLHVVLADELTSQCVYPLHLGPFNGGSSIICLAQAKHLPNKR